LSKAITKKLNFIGVAAMYVGSIMGAGFASGRESWQFFGVFGNKAYLGVLISSLGFAMIAFMVNYISQSRNTTDIGRIVWFTDNRIITEAIGYSMAAFLFTTIISMSAAGGSFLNQEFGISKIIGGGIIAFLVAITVIGDFERISRLFKYIVPLLFAVVIIVSFIVIFSGIGQSGATGGFKVSEMAPNWIVAALVFIAYNMLGMIPMGAAASLNARNGKHALAGSVIGGTALGIMTLVLVLALQKDMAYTNSLDLPMLGYSLRVSAIANVLYGLVLYASIYSAATSTFYGFTTKLPDRPWKKYVILAAITVGFIIGLTGFKNIVAYLYPVEGYYGWIIIILMTWSFIHEVRHNREMKKRNISDIYGEFPGNDRFHYPDNMTRVTSGYGGESILVFGEEKTALYDTGMAYCHQGTVENIRKALEDHGRCGLDYILMSHTHYDHIGALPYLLREWPEAVVVGSAKAKKVFSSEGARATMKRLGEYARDNYVKSDEPVSTEGLRVDMVVGDGDRVDIGDAYFVVIETKGHTDCSLTYVLEPQGIMFASESTGVIRGPGQMHTAILKSYRDTMESAAKCREYRPRQIIGPHYGILPPDMTDYYFDLYVKAAEEEKAFILGCRDSGMTEKEIFRAFDKKYWSDERGRAQPRAAFLENAKYSVKHILENY